MKKRSYNFAIARKIAKGMQLTQEEQKFVNEYVNELLKNCEQTKL